MVDMNYSNLQVNNFQTKELVKDYLDAKGAYRTLGACENICSWFSFYGKKNDVNESLQNSITSSRTLFNRGKKVLSIPKLYGGTKDFVECFSKGPGRIVQKSSGLINDYCRVFSLAELIDGIKFSKFARYAIGYVTEVSSVINDTIDISGNVKKYSHLQSDQNELGQINSKADSYLSESKKITLIKIAKTIAGLASSLFIIIGSLMNVALAGSLFLLSMSTVTLVAAVTIHFFEKTMTYQIPKEETV